MVRFAHGVGVSGSKSRSPDTLTPCDPDTPHPSPSSADIHEGWLSAGKRATAGEGALATAGDDAAFALALASLTKRQRQLVRLRARGLTIAEICDRYYLSENTVKNHLHGAFRTLGLGGLRHQARLGRACYLLGRHDASRRSGVVSRES
jgi:DNA-binding CsgD family transcriptional regulator